MNYFQLRGSQFFALCRDVVVSHSLSVHRSHIVVASVNANHVSCDNVSVRLEIATQW